MATALQFTNEALCAGKESLPSCSSAALTLLNLIAALYGLPKKRFPVSDGSNLAETDFLVIGGGTTGSVVAGKLVEHDAKVVVLEEGEQYPEATSIPAFYELTRNSNFVRSYLNQPCNSSFLKRENGSFPYVRGKGLGGSMPFTLREYHRGIKEDFDAWKQPPFSYDRMLKTFKELEDNRDPEYAVNTKYHATGGKLTVEKLKYSSLFTQLENQGAKSKNALEIDINAEQWPGTMRMQFYSNRGRLTDTFERFVMPQQGNKKLTVVTKAVVTKIIFNDKGTKATEVEYILNGATKKIKVKKEVILAAGAIDSPKILMNSGIGPEKILKEAGIKVIKNLPVGENLSDRVSFDGIVFETEAGDYDLESSFREHVEEYLGQSTGPLAGVGPAGFTAILKVPNEEKLPTIQLLRRAVDPDEFFADPNFVGNAKPAPYATKAYMLHPTILKPFSRGRVQIDPKNPQGPPLIHLGALSDERDLNLLGESGARFIGMEKSDIYTKAKTAVVKKKLPGCEDFEMDKPDYWKCAAKSYTRSMGGPIGTCQMGKVVNSDLRVKDIENLRVVDASVLLPVSADPQTAAIAVAYRAAKFILVWDGKLPESALTDDD